MHLKAQSFWKFMGGGALLSETQKKGVFSQIYTWKGCVEVIGFFL